MIFMMRGYIALCTTYAWAVFLVGCSLWIMGVAFVSMGLWVEAFDIHIRLRYFMATGWE